MEIGDKVKLNDYGISVAFGRTEGLSFMKKRIYTVIHKEYIPLSDESYDHTFLITVDNPGLSNFVLYSECFDLA